MKINMYRFLSVLCIALTILLGAWQLTHAAESIDSSAQDTVKLEIMAPSAGELIIAPGRHFKVSGCLTGVVPDDAVLKVSLLDASGYEVRYAQTDQKGIDRVVPYSCGGKITVFDAGTDFTHIAYTAPELVVTDVDDPQASSHDATIKCVYTDDTFYALIVSATDPEHGLAEEDGYDLVDHEGKPYNALPEGEYTVLAVLSSSSGEELASTSEEIEIGRTAGTVIHEITNRITIEKGGKDLLHAWAAREDLTILDDLLPGMFGEYYQMSTMPMAVSCETAEYLPGKIKMLVYGNKTSSVSYVLEEARYLQLKNNVENPDIAEYYVFSLGEPCFEGEPSEIVKLEEDVHICRIDHVVDETIDGVFITTEEQVLWSDMDPSDGWTVDSGAFAIAGVIKPYQLREDEIVPDGEVYGYYNYLNWPDTLVYTFTPGDGSDAFSITKYVGISRIDAVAKKSDPAVYEFYNVFPADTLKEGISYDVDMQAYDREGDAIEGAECRFRCIRSSLEK